MPSMTQTELLDQMVKGGDAMATVLRKMLSDRYDHRKEAEQALLDWQSPKVVALHRISNPT